jgi:methionyl-tRNA synthetase
MNPCPECGHPMEAKTCTHCGHALANGQPEVNGCILQKTPPEMIEEMRRTFNEEEFLAELHETERNGGAELKDFLHKLEQEADCS